MRSSVPILMYHSIAPADMGSAFRRWTVSPENFAEQMAYLAHEHYVTLTVSQLMERSGAGPVSLPGRAVVLTFDDGFADFCEAALPVLNRYGFTATLYITTGYVGSASRWLGPPPEGARPMLDWDQIRAISAQGIEIGGHGHTHRALDSLAGPALATEVRHCKAVLEAEIAQPVRSFAYPFGFHTASVRREVQAACYTSACAVEVSLPNNDAFCLRRHLVADATSPERLAGLLTAQRATALDLARGTWPPIKRAALRWAASKKRGQEQRV